jgi:hypothetical protein
MSTVPIRNGERDGSIQAEPIDALAPPIHLDTNTPIKSPRQRPDPTRSTPTRSSTKKGDYEQFEVDDEVEEAENIAASSNRPLSARYLNALELDVLNLAHLADWLGNQTLRPATQEAAIALLKDLALAHTLFRGEYDLKSTEIADGRG